MPAAIHGTAVRLTPSLSEGSVFFRVPIRSMNTRKQTFELNPIRHHSTMARALNPTAAGNRDCLDDGPTLFHPTPSMIIHAPTPPNNRYAQVPAASGLTALTARA